MKLANVVEGGLTGATTLTLLQEALHKIDSKAPRPLLHKSGVIKKLKKRSGKPGLKTNKLYINLAEELLTNAAYFGLTALGKKKNVVLRGGLLGAAAGLGVAFMNDEKEEDDTDPTRKNGLPGTNHKKNMKKKILTVALYTAGGILAGMAIKKLNKPKKKKKK